MSLRKWLPVALALCAMTAGCTDFNTNLTIQTSSSSISFLSPSSVSAGNQGFILSVNGQGFTSGAIILWYTDPTKLPTQLVTTLVSSVVLTAPVPANLLIKSGQIQVAVQIPGSAATATSNVYNTTTTEISNIVYFNVAALPGPPPTVTSLSASTTSAASAPYCSPSGLTLTVNGTNFVNTSTANGQAVPASVVYWNGSARPTTYVSSTQLTAAIPATDTAFQGTAIVTVFNDAASTSPGTSNGSPFTMLTPSTALAAPSGLTLSQTSAAVGSPALSPMNNSALSVTGTNILPCSSAQWVSPTNVVTALTAAYVPASTGSASLSVTVPASDLQSAGSAQVQIVNPAPGGGSSGASFTLLPPAISSVTASASAACVLTAPTLTVTGTNFAANSIVNWNGSPRLTSYVAATQTTPAYLTALLTVADAANSGTTPVTVSTGSVVSNSYSFLLAAPSGLPAPSISSVLPANATAGTSGVNLVLTDTGTGTNFLPCSVVEWNSTPLATTFSPSSGQLTAFVPASDILNVGTAQLSVVNPANPTPPGGGGTSNVLFPIVAPAVVSLSGDISPASTPNNAPSCGFSGMNLTVTGTNFVNGLVVNWNGSSRPTTYVSPTQLIAAISAADTAFPGPAAVTVSSSTITSNGPVFTLTAPASGTLQAPVINSLTPSKTTAGNPAFLLGTSGSGWAPCTMIEWNGESRTTLFVGATGATAPISAADVASSGLASVIGVNPTATGGSSNPPVSFPIFLPPGGQASGSASAAGALATPYASATGRYIVFVLASTDGKTEVPGSTENIFLQDTCPGAASGCTPAQPILVSAGTGSAAANAGSFSPSISADGRYVAFLSYATNLIASDTNTQGYADVFLWDSCTGVTTGCTPSMQIISTASGTSGPQANGGSTSAAVNSDGRFVTFRSTATNLDLSSTATTGLFLRDTCNGVVAPATCTPSTAELQ